VPKRVIPVLLLKKNGLYKTKLFSNPTYIGDPINAIRIFNDKYIDELILLDISASKNNSKPNFNLLYQICGECFMPLCYGGGIDSLDTAKNLFQCGIEKVSLQSSILENTKLIEQIAKIYGSQSIVASIDVKKNIFNNYKIYSHKLNKSISLNLNDYIKSLIDSGVGEILINSVDRDGLMKGLDLELIKLISMKSTVPVIAMGGVGSLNHIIDGFEAGADAVAAGSFFVFHGVHRAVLITYLEKAIIEEFNNY
jgi:cyclase